MNYFYENFRSYFGGGPGGDSQETSQKYKMRCHYEVLEVSRNADDDTIKKAYRRQALVWHPGIKKYRILDRVVS